MSDMDEPGICYTESRENAPVTKKHVWMQTERHSTERGRSVLLWKGVLGMLPEHRSTSSFPCSTQVCILALILWWLMLDLSNGNPRRILWSSPLLKLYIGNHSNKILVGGGPPWTLDAPLFMFTTAPMAALSVQSAVRSISVCCQEYLCPLSGVSQSAVSSISVCCQLVSQSAVTIRLTCTLSLLRLDKPALTIRLYACLAYSVCCHYTLLLWLYASLAHWALRGQISLLWLAAVQSSQPAVTMPTDAKCSACCHYAHRCKVLSPLSLCPQMQSAQPDATLCLDDSTQLTLACPESTHLLFVSIAFSLWWT